MKDKDKWKGRSILDPGEQAEKEHAKKQAADLKLLRQQSIALKKFQAKKRKELKMKY